MSDLEQTDWQKLPVDPEPGDLGYERPELDITESSTESGDYVIHPHTEEFLSEAAYILADENSMLDLRDML